MADIKRVSTSYESEEIFSFCFTPKRCSSSIITNPRFLNKILSDNTARVPTRISTRRWRTKHAKHGHAEPAAVFANATNATNATATNAATAAAAAAILAIDVATTASAVSTATRPAVQPAAVSTAAVNFSINNSTYVRT